MKKMKRFLVALLSCVTAIACVAGLAACNNDNDQSTSSSSPAASSSSSSSEEASSSKTEESSSSDTADNSSNDTTDSGNSSIEEDSSSAVDPATCEHSGGTATCTEQAVCEKCGASYGELKDHEWGDLIVSVAADCTNDGAVAHYACAHCDAVSLDGTTVAAAEDVVIAADAATYHADKAHLTHVLGQNATCEDAGWTEYYYCPVCQSNAEDKDEEGNYVNLDQYIPVEKEYKESENFTITIKVVRETIPALGHNYVSYYDYLYAMTAAGSMTELEFRILWIENYGCWNPDGYYCEFGPVCTNCMDWKPGIGHKVGTPATCHTLAVCEHCHHEFGEYDLTKHDWANAKEVVAHVDATCFTDEVYQVLQCNNCNTEDNAGYYAIVKTDKNGHIVYEPITADEYAQGFVDLENNTGDFVKPDSKINHVSDGFVAATCTEDAYCPLCDKRGTDLGDDEKYVAHGHAFLPENVVAAVPAYCDKNGVKEHYTCSHCDAVSLTANSQAVATEEDLVILAYHTWVLKDAKAPTCIDEGHYAYYYCTGTHSDGTPCTCVAMGASIEAAEVVAPEEIIDPATGNHVCANASDYCTNMVKCDYCGYYVVKNPNPAKHHFELVDGVVKCTGEHCDKVFVYNEWNGGDYYVSDADSLQYLAEAVKMHNMMEGCTVYLLADIDLQAFGNFTPIGNGEFYFHGIFEGNNHTISNLTINCPDQTYVGLFGVMGDDVPCEATIRNLTIDGANVTGYSKVGVIAGTVWTGNIENCVVKNATVVCKDTAAKDVKGEGDKAGAICGYIHNGVIKNCAADTVTITANRDAGQLVGCLDGTFEGDNTVQNVTVTKYGTYVEKDGEDNEIITVKNELAGRVIEPKSAD